jgi:hypothetical protein
MKGKCIDNDENEGIHINGEYEILEKNSVDYFIINDNKNKCWFPKELFEIIPILITDQMINIILECVFCGSYSDDYFNEIKTILKEKGYAVEESKSKLDEAREYKLDFDLQNKTG